MFDNDTADDALPNGSLLFCEDTSSIYIPKRFADEIDHANVTGVTEKDWCILQDGPDHEWYWEAWNDIIETAVITHPQTGIRYRLYQDGDLWLIPLTACEPNPETDE